MLGVFLFRFRFLLLASIAAVAVGCNAPTSVKETSSLLPTTPVTKFADGTKGVRINLHTNATKQPSFATVTATPTPTYVPTTYGGDGSIQYNPGISATYYYDLDTSNTTPITKPDWLLDFQVGINDVPGSAKCATFGGSGAFDLSGYFRVSEVNCASKTNGTGRTSDQTFIRIVLDRDTAVLGSKENLMVQIEYQASGIIPYTANLNGVDINDVSSNGPEDLMEQLWKVYWNNTLDQTSAMKPFATFVPPNYSSCSTSIAGAAAPAHCVDAGYTGAPVRVRQFMFPLSSYGDANVIQFSRLHSWASDGGTAAARQALFCTSDDSPFCSGVVIHSVTLLRI